jgi:uncharacterized RDD family membrane protein YckC
MNYAGFWIRTGALLIDLIVLTAVDALFQSLFYGSPELCYSEIEHVYEHGVWHENPSYGCHIGGEWWDIFTYWIYFTVLESSKWQATVGKHVLKLKVTDINGIRISFGRANARFWSKILSFLILFIAFIMVGFTQKKEGLHDFIAGTLVLKTR